MKQQEHSSDPTEVAAGNLRPTLGSTLGSGALLLALGLWALGGRPAEAQDTTRLNPFLGPDYSSWLAGAVGEMATEEEQQEYLLLEDDEQAQEFIARFWSVAARERVRRTYDLRFEEAEKRFAEGVYSGGRTDRGAIFVLYGEPEKIEFEQFRDVSEPDVEIWRYPKKGDRGLDGERPDRTYRFVKIGELTRRFKRGGPNDPTVRRRRDPFGSQPARRPFE